MGKFRDDVQKNVDRIKSDIEGRIKKGLKSMFGDIVMATPVDTGTARGGWVCGVDGKPDGNSGAPDQAGANTVARIAAELENFKIGKTQQVWLSNSVPYIEFLEYGTMKRAPVGMVRNAIDNLDKYLGR